METRLLKATAIFCFSAALISCATTPERAVRDGRLWQERINRIGQETEGADALCLATGQFQLNADETVVSRDEGNVTVRGPAGDFTIHENRFATPIPTATALANRDLFGAFYRFDDPRIGYIVTLFHPVQDGEFVVAWIDGAAFNGGPSDSAIYSRYGFGVGSTACKS
ncbi:MAG: hypothetical protein LCH57_02510 [Proteobacteria bacterium]|nr:hypothetical protein [Pseudomonadota bacterium]